MNDREFAATATNQAFGYYLDTVNSVLELAGTVYILFGGAGKLTLPDNTIREVFGGGADMAIDTAQKHFLQGHKTMHSLILLAMWSAFESMVVDICISTLQAEPQLLESKPFEKVSLPANAVLLARSEQIALIGKSAFNDPRQPVGNTGKGKFENQLDIVGLEGSVPDDVAKALVVANAYRNVIAHRGHHADDRLLEACPGAGLQIGDVVRINRAQSNEFVIALQTYAIIIINRVRAKHGLELIKCHQNGNPFAASFNAMFPTAVDPLELSRRLNS